MKKAILAVAAGLITVAGSLYAQNSQYDLSGVSNAQILEEMKYRLSLFSAPVLKRLTVQCQGNTLVVKTDDGRGNQIHSYSNYSYRSNSECEQQERKVEGFTRNTYDTDRLNRFDGYRVFNFCWVDSQNLSRLITIDVDDSGKINKVGEFRVLDNEAQNDFVRGRATYGLVSDGGARLCDGLTDNANKTLLNGISRRDQGYWNNRPSRGNGRGF